MYNLRSHKQSRVQLPVEIQLSDDNQFLQKIIDQSCVISDIKQICRIQLLKDPLVTLIAVTSFKILIMKAHVVHKPNQI